MNNDLWFKRKVFGWGWTPANAKGWAVTFIFACALLVPRRILTDFDSKNPLYWMYVVAVILGFIGVCWWKGEKPKWQWGSKR